MSQRRRSNICIGMTEVCGHVLAVVTTSTKSDGCARTVARTMPLAAPRGQAQSGWLRGQCVGEDFGGWAARFAQMPWPAWRGEILPAKFVLGVYARRGHVSRSGQPVCRQSISVSTGFMIATELQCWRGYALTPPWSSDCRLP